MRWTFGPFVLDATNERLWRNGEVLNVRRKSFEVLTHLVIQAGELVRTDELLDQVWTNTAVGDAVVKVSIRELRQLLGETSRAPQYIATVYGRGYRFIAEVTEASAADIPSITVTSSITQDDRSESEKTFAEERPPPLPESERRSLTVLFCDLVDSTPLSQRLDPEDLGDVLNAYYGACSQAVEQFDGHVAQYLGDGLLVYFGYPRVHEDAARRAAHAGLQMLQAMSILNSRLQAAYGIVLDVRIGLDTGMVVVGENSTGEWATQLAVGAVPNIAARIQNQAQVNQVWVSESTHQLIEGYFSVVDMGQHQFRGVATPLRLYRVIAANESQHRLDIQPVERLTPFVGRELECLVFQERWRQVQQSRGCVMLLSGEAGMGKSRLARAMLSTVSQESHLLLESRCSPYHQHTAFHPIVDFLKRLMQIEASTTAKETIDRLIELVRQCGLETLQSLPLLAALLDLPLPLDLYPSLDMSPAQWRQCTLETLLNLVVALSEEQPVVFFIEDAHWLDPSTLEWLGLLVDRGPMTPLLTLITCRPEFEAPWQNRSHVSVLTLNQLSESQVRQMAQSLVGSAPMTSAMINHIIHTSDGVPLFVEEITRFLIESEASHGVSAHPLSTSHPPTFQIPATLQDLLAARLNFLGAAKRTAQLAATIGREFSFELLQAVSPLELALLQQDLNQLVKAELVYQQGLPPRATYIFKHALIQETAYQSMLRRTRQRHHEQIARVLLEQFSDTTTLPPNLVAYHLTEAQLYEPAIEYWRQAGQQAIAYSALTEVIEHLSHGLALIEKLPKTVKRARQELSLLTTLGPTLIATKGGMAPEVGRLYTRANALCEEVGDLEQRFLVLNGLRRFHWTRGSLRTALGYAQELLLVTDQQGNPAWRLEAHLALGETQSFQGELRAARVHYEKCFELYDGDRHRADLDLYPRDSAVSAYGNYAAVLGLLGYVDQARHWISETLTLAQDLSHPFSIALAHLKAAEFFLFYHEFATAQTHAKTLVSMCVEQGFDSFHVRGEVLLGISIVGQGQIEVGTKLIDDGLAQLSELNMHTILPGYFALAIDNYRGQQTGEHRQHLMRQAELHLEQAEAHLWTAEWYRLKGESCWAQPIPDTKAALAYYRQAFNLASDQHAKSLQLRAAISLHRVGTQSGQCPESRDLLASTYAWFAEGMECSDLHEARSLLISVSP